MSTFNRRTFVVLLAATSLLAATACSSQEEGAAEADKPVFTVGGTGTSYPHSYKEGDKLLGFDTDVIAEAASRAGYRVEFTTMDFPGLLGAVSSGRIDTTATNVTWTPERGATYVWTTAYAFDGVGLATATDSPIQRPEELDGKTVSAGTGSTNFTAVEEWAKKKGLNVTVRGYDTAQSALQDVIVGRVEAGARPWGATNAEIEKKGVRLRLLGDPITDEQTRYPFADNERGRKLAQEISVQLQAMEADGTLKKLSEKYFDYDRTVGADDPKYATPDPRQLTVPDGDSSTSVPVEAATSASPSAKG